MGRAAILHAGALGDLILTLNLAGRIDQIARCERVTLISRIDPGAAAVARWPALRRVSIEGIGSHWLYTDSLDPTPLPLAELLEEGVVVSALGGPESVVAAQLVKLNPRAAFHLDPVAIVGSVRHITDQWRDRIGVQGAAVKACIYARQHAAGCEMQNLKSNMQYPESPPAPARTILIHPGSGGRAKCWHTAGFVAVANLLAQRGVAGRFVIGPAERERWPRDAISRLEDTAKVLPFDQIDEFSQALASADAYIGNDSGPTHLAAWLGTPTLALFGPTDARIWRPIGDRVTCLQGDPTRDTDSWGIQPETVVAAVLGDAL